MTYSNFFLSPLALLIAGPAGEAAVPPAAAPATLTLELSSTSLDMTDSYVTKTTLTPAHATSVPAEISARFRWQIESESPDKEKGGGYPDMPDMPRPPAYSAHIVSCRTAAAGEAIAITSSPQLVAYSFPRPGRYRVRRFYALPLRDFEAACAFDAELGDYDKPLVSNWVTVTVEQ